MKSITLASIVFTLSVCLNLVAGTKPYLGDVEDTEDNKGVITIMWKVIKKEVEMCIPPGSVVSFEYKQGNHNVLQVSSRDYERCTGITNTAGVWGPVRKGPLSQGTYYFVCGVGLHCKVGKQKAKITVSDKCDTDTGERGTYKFRTKRDLQIGGNIEGGHVHNAPGSYIDVGGDVNAKLTGYTPGVRAGGKINGN